MPEWVEECIRRYMAQGLSEEEAAQRCYGAYHNRGGRSAELPQPPAGLEAEEQRLWLETYAGVYAQTGDPLKAELAAWGAVRKVEVRHLLGLKAVRQGGYRVVGWGMRFSDGDDRDLHGQYFTEATRLLQDYYRDAPLFYEHGADPVYGTDPIGRRAVIEVYPHGVWVEHDLDPHHPQYRRTLQEVADGLLAYSGDTMQHILEEGFDFRTGEIGTWPVAAWSLVRMPAEPGLGPVQLKAVVQALRAYARPHASEEVTPGGQAPALRQGQAPALRRGQAPASRSFHNVRPEAREAQGTGDTPAAATGRSGSPRRARPSGTPAGVRATTTGENNPMDELLTLLADFFGVEATPEAVLPVLDEFIAWLEGQGGEEAEGEMAAAFAALDLEAVKAAFGLEGEADRAAIREKVAQLRAALQPPPEQAVQPVFNYQALERASAAVASAARSAPPLPDPLPYMTRQQAPGAKSARLPRFNVNRGVPHTPILDMLHAHAAGNPARAAKAVGDVGPGGGYLLNRLLADEIIEPLYAEEVVMAAGARVERFPGSESLTFRKMNAGAAAYWAGAGQAVDDSQPFWGVVHIQPKELVARTLIHNKTLRNADARLEGQVRDDITMAIALAMDLAFLFGSGGRPAGSGHSGAEPLGLLHTPDVTITELGTGNGATPTFKDIEKVIGRLEDANVRETPTWRWVFHPRTKRTFTNMKDASGQYVLRRSYAQGEEPDILGYRYHTTTQIPTSVQVGTSGDCSYLFLGRWEDFVVGLSLDVELVVDTSRYINERQTLIQAVTYVDCGVLYPQSFQVLSGVRP